MDISAVVPPGSLPIFGSALLLGLLHGAEPGHGWPIAATYALDRDHKWFHGLAASVLLGLGHLVSSLAVVALFFFAKSALALERLNEPYTVGPVAIGGPVGIVAGLLLIGLGIREYRNHGHSHGEDHGHEHAHGPDGHEHDHAQHGHGHQHAHDHGGHASDGAIGWAHRLRRRLPFWADGGHDHPAPSDLDRKGLLGIVWTAFVLGFVHEEEFEIIGLCLGSSLCIELMLVYALAVLLALVGLTVLLIAGYRRYEDRMERCAEHFPTVSAVVLIGIGLGFVLGLL
jgi:hypothetical protein